MDLIVAKVRKNSKAELWITLQEFKERQYVDLREYFLATDDLKWHPTKKGIKLTMAQLPALIDALDGLQDESEIGTYERIQKSQRTEIQVGIREFAKHKYGDVRIWYSMTTTDEKQPSRKGITFRPELTSQLLEGLRDAKEAVIQ